MTDKRCSRCGELKDASDFYTTVSRGNSYLSGACKPCHNQASKKSYDKKMSSEVTYRVRRLLHSVRQRCDKYGYAFDLTEQWVLEKYLRGVCEATNLPLNIFDHGGVGERPWGPSLDRVDQTKGYTKDNVQLVSWIYNRAKGSGTHEDVLILAKALVAANDNVEQASCTN